MSRSSSSSNRFFLEGAFAGTARGLARIYKEGKKGTEVRLLDGSSLPLLVGGYTGTDFMKADLAVCIK